MPTLSEIEKLIPQLNPRLYTKLLKMKEISELETFLHSDETILRITSAILKGSGKNGVFVATNNRCFFLYKGGLFSHVSSEQFAYDKISSVEFSTGLISAELVIYASGNKIELSIIKEEVRDLCEFLNSQSRKKPEPVAPPASANTGNDMIAQLERLAHLKEIAAITEEEFVVAKKKLLGM